MKENILKLRGAGLSYKQIVKELGCSIGTVSYHCGSGQKEKTKNRNIRFKEGKTSPVIKKIKNCKCCKSVLTNSASLYCSISCHKKYQYDDYINDWKSGKNDGTKSGGFLVSGYVRRYLFEKHQKKCSRCGWDTENPFIDKVILEVEHLDGNSSNNRENNLDLICPNCHSLTATYKALNFGNGNRQRLKYNKLI